MNPGMNISGRAPIGSPKTAGFTCRMRRQASFPDSITGREDGSDARSGEQLRPSDLAAIGNAQVALRSAAINGFAARGQGGSQRATGFASAA